MLFAPLRVLLNPYLLPVILFGGGFAAFRIATPACGAIPDDAHVFVLTGDARRIPFALEKLENHPNRKLYVIGAGTPKIDTEFSSRIEVESDSKSTYENAVAIRHIARRKLLADITVITTVDHVNRAVFLIKREIPLVRVNACPAPLSNMPAAKRLNRWMEEYVKFLGTLIGITQRA
ncbi:MAG: YdcF family protein [Rickettsiales bacterium]|jgi:uncharacterized SAM-binding protein YcdF (DUF218 family)|nr:YdcF family protein [Rickettsiales bacterium]